MSESGPNDYSTDGSSRRARAQGARTEQLIGIVREMDPDVASWVDDFVFGRVWGRPGLEFEERQLTAIAMLAATQQPRQLRVYLHGALQDGIPPDQIREVLAMTAVYAGFPALMHALEVWSEVRAAYEKTSAHSE
jgi:4-carboxymuconolactone decarboxylase